MPYFRSARVYGTMPVSGINVSTGADYVTPATVNVAGDLDLSYRYKAPQGDFVQSVDRSAVEPYSWFKDLNKLKLRAFRKDPRFDPGLFREDKGHAWDNRKWTFEGGYSFRWRSSTGTQIQYTNCALRAASNDFLLPPAPPTDLESQAAVWYGRMAPVVSEFSLATFLGELREGLPRLLPDIISKANFARSVGNDYLNVEFGWKPLLDDLRKIAEVLYSASIGLYKPLGTYHRRRQLKPVETFSRDQLVYTPTQLRTGNYLSGLDLIPSTDVGAGTTLLDISGSVVKKTKLTRWYEGEFVYIPKASFDPTSYLDRMDTLMNVQLSPAALWELAPWSWLTDWFFQIGGAISAMEAGMSNRVLSTYYYAMEEYEASVQLDVTAQRLRSGTSTLLPPWYHQRAAIHTKRRIRGNPFGFTGTSSSPLSVEQSAILGALGLKKT